MPRPWRAAARYGTSLLQEGQRGYAFLGQLYARVKLFEGQFLSLYRQIYDTPYMNRLQGTLGGKDGEPALRYGGGEVRLVSSARRRGAVRGAVHGRAQRGWRPPHGLRLPHRYPKAVERQPRLHQRHGAELRSRG